MEGLNVMYAIETIDEGVIFDNPLPQLKSRQGYFPNIVSTDSGRLIAAFTVGEAMESVDSATVISESTDEGKTWKMISSVIDKTGHKVPLSDCMKITYAGGSKLLALGYAFSRPDERLPLGNPQTGGLLDDQVIYTESNDLGLSWEISRKIETTFGSHVEASAPVTILKNGWYAAPIANFPNWDGTFEHDPCGRFLVSKDKGRTWDDSSLTMRFPEGHVSAYEQRACQLGSGDIVVISWNEDLKTGKRLPNHYCISSDNGRTFTEPKSTGIMGQTASVMSFGGNRVLALHCRRRDTDKPGIYAYIADLSRGEWDILSEKKVWAPALPMAAMSNMAEVFSFIRFGQPSAIPLGKNVYMMVNWVIEDGQGKIAWHKLRIE
jgi:sialidase-1